MEPFSVREATLPNVLGWNREEIRAWRKACLVGGADYATIHRAIHWTPDAVLKAREAIEASNPLSDSPPEKNAAPRTLTDVPEPPAPVLLWVHRAGLLNPKIILACPKGDDPVNPQKVVRVKVRDGSKFVRFLKPGTPMEFPAREVGPDLYEMARPCPRYRGRW